MRKLLLSVILMTGLSAENLEEVFKIGQSGAKELLKTLGGEMKKQMASGDIKKAINFCSQEAQTLTNKVDEALGENVSIKRISTKYRSPANKPTKTEAKILFMLESTNSPLLTKVSDNEYKFYQPLRIGKPVCLNCHGKGEDMSEVARKTIHELYPQDKATNYNFGDLRGAVVVTIKRGETE
jgi:5'-3' exonuclease